MTKFFKILIFWSLSTFPISSYSQNQVIDEVGFKDFLSKSGIAMLRGETNKAISHLNECLKINPNSSVANFQLARLYYSSNDFEACINYGTKAHKLKPDNKYYCEFLAKVYEANFQKKEALHFYELALPDNPTYEQFQDYCNIYQKFDAGEQLLSTLKKMEEIYGYDYFIGNSRAMYFMQNRDLKSAEVEYVRLSRIDENNLVYLVLLQNFYKDNNKLAESQKVQEKINALKPQKPTQLLSDNLFFLTNGQIDLFYANLVQSLRNDNSYDFNDKLQHLEFFVRDQRLNVDSLSKAFTALTETYPNQIQVYADHSSFLMMNNRIEAAQQVLKNCLDSDKSVLEIWVRLFKVCAILEDFATMLNYAEECLEYYPDQSEVYMYKAIAEMYTSNFKTADEDFVMAEDLGINFSKSSDNFLFYRGAYYYFTGNQKKAFENFFKKFLDKHIDDYYLNLQLAYFFIDNGTNLKVAETIINEYANDYNLNYYFYFVRAYFNIRKKNLQQSREDILKAINLEDSKYYVYNLAGDIFANLGDCTNAIIYWNQSIDRGGNSSVISNKINNCK